MQYLAKDNYQYKTLLLELGSQTLRDSGHRKVSFGKLLKDKQLL